MEITTEDITVDPSGKECSVSYTLTNGVEGGTVSAQSPADWIGDVNDDAEGVVTFTVLPNDTESDSQHHAVCDIRKRA